MCPCVCYQNLICHWHQTFWATETCQTFLECWDRARLNGGHYFGVSPPKMAKNAENHRKTLFLGLFQYWIELIIYHMENAKKWYFVDVYHFFSDFLNHHMKWLHYFSYKSNLKSELVLLLLLLCHDFYISLYTIHTVHYSTVQCTYTVRYSTVQLQYYSTVLWVAVPESQYCSTVL